MATQNNQKTSAVKGKKGFTKGLSGNPGGRPRIDPEIVELAKLHTIDAVLVFVDVMKNGTDDKSRVDAADKLLNRAWGKPTDFVKISTPEGETINLTVAQAIDFAAIRAKAGKK